MCRRVVPVLMVVVAVSGHIGASAGEEPKAVAEELKRFEGEWRIVAAEQGGEAVESNDLVVFAGRKCTVTDPDTKIAFENTIAIDPSKSPKRIEVTSTRTKQTWAGIYELKGDTLRILHFEGKDARPPAEFKTRKGRQEIMFTYERVKPK